MPKKRRIKIRFEAVERFLYGRSEKRWRLSAEREGARSSMSKSLGPRLGLQVSGPRVLTPNAAFEPVPVRLPLICIGAGETTSKIDHSARNFSGLERFVPVNQRTNGSDENWSNVHQNADFQLSHPSTALRFPSQIRQKL